MGLERYTTTSGLLWYSGRSVRIFIPTLMVTVLSLHLNLSKQVALPYCRRLLHALGAWLCRSPRYTVRPHGRPSTALPPILQFFLLGPTARPCSCSSAALLSIVLRQESREGDLWAGIEIFFTFFEYKSPVMHVSGPFPLQSVQIFLFDDVRHLSTACLYIVVDWCF